MAASPSLSVPRPLDNKTPCTTCGSTAPEPLYATTLDRSTCEHCLLEAKRQLMDLEGDPYEAFVESLAAALDLRERVPPAGAGAPPGYMDNSSLLKIPV